MKNTALIMIDMQCGFIDPSSPLCIAGAAATVPACAEVIRFFHENELPVFYAVRHYRADGSDVEKARAKTWAEGGKPMSEVCDENMSDAFPESFEVLASDHVFVKPRFSAFFRNEPRPCSAQTRRADGRARWHDNAELHPNYLLRRTVA